jgi:type IX secretion system PorP/SprF family membrane protein
MKKIHFIFLIALGFLSESQAQQDPHYTQYMYNMNVINPAYAGSKENLSFGLLYRKQWVDIEDAPSTFTLSGSSPVGKNVGNGLSVISDKIGSVEENNVLGAMAYPNPFTDNIQLQWTSTVSTKTNIMVFDMYGKLVSSNTTLSAAGINRFDNPLPKLAAGIYMLRLNVEGLGATTIKLVKQ